MRTKGQPIALYDRDQAYIANLAMLPSPCHSVQLLLGTIYRPGHLIHQEVADDALGDGSGLVRLVPEFADDPLALLLVLEDDQEVALVGKVQFEPECQSAAANAKRQTTHATSRNRKARLLVSTISL